MSSITRMTKLGDSFLIFFLILLAQWIYFGLVCEAIKSFSSTVSTHVKRKRQLCYIRSDWITWRPHHTKEREKKVASSPSTKVNSSLLEQRTAVTQIGFIRAILHSPKRYRMASPTAQLVSQLDFLEMLMTSFPSSSITFYVDGSICSVSLNGATTLKSRAAYHKGIMSCLTFDRLHWWHDDNASSNKRYHSRNYFCLLFLYFSFFIPSFQYHKTKTKKNNKMMKKMEEKNNVLRVHFCPFWWTGFSYI
jgi:hypothetical protein